jgi:hypothetical protein
MKAASFKDRYAFWSLSISITVVLLVFNRTFYGIDFTDESFYLSIPYRFVLGDRPFIDEYSIAQLQALIMFPIVKVYYSVIGNIDYIMLFMRILYVLFTCIVAGVAFSCLKQFIWWQIALPISLIPIVFVPANVLNFSYNTLGIGFFTMGCFLCLSFLMKDKRKVTLVLGAVCHSLTIIAYPTLIATIIVYFFILLYLLRENRKVIITYIVSGIITMIPFLLVIFPSGYENYNNIHSFLFSLNTTSTGLQKLIAVLTTCWNKYDQKLLVFILLLIIGIGLKLKVNQIRYLCLFFPLIPISINNLFLSSHNPGVITQIINGFVGVYLSMGYMLYYSLFAPFFLTIIDKNKQIKNLFIGIWVPSVLTGLIIALSSGNGYLNAGIGLLPASMVTATFLCLVFGSQNKRSMMGAFVSIFMMIFILLFFLYNAVYRDESINNLKFRMDTGPFAGLYTSEDKQKYINELVLDLKQYLHKDDKVLFYDNFPAGYLLTKSKPATISTWLFPMCIYPNQGKNRQAVLDYYAKEQILPDTVVKLENIYCSKDEQYPLVYPADDVLNNMIESDIYRNISTKPNYSIYRLIK